MAVKVVDGLNLFIEASVNAAFDALTLESCLREIKFCCLGPSATTLAVVELLGEWRSKVEALPEDYEVLCDSAKVNAMRAVGVAVVNRQAIHPNTKFVGRLVGEACARQGPGTTGLPHGAAQVATRHCMTKALLLLSDMWASDSFIQRVTGEKWATAPVLPLANGCSYPC